MFYLKFYIMCSVVCRRQMVCGGKIQKLVRKVGTRSIPARPSVLVIIFVVGVVRVVVILLLMCSLISRGRSGLSNSSVSRFIRNYMDLPHCNPVCDSRNKRRNDWLNFGVCPSLEIQSILQKLIRMESMI